MRNWLKSVASSVSIDTWERLLSYSVLRHRQGLLAQAKVFETREALWNECLLGCVGREKRMTFVEFGVHQGYSMNHFNAGNDHPESLFVGLDSFDGLPEDWGTVMSKGAFDVKGVIPVARDARVHYLKGWFQQTADDLLARIGGRQDSELVVHYDADLYSSTLFALTQIATLKRPYVAIFDEFTGHESRALFNFCQAYNADVTFLGKTLWRGAFPQQVLCRIAPGHVAAA